MSRAPNKSCAYRHCGAPLREDQARFEVRVAPGFGHVAGTYCSYGCWEAEKARISVENLRERLHSDAETVLADEGRMFPVGGCHEVARVAARKENTGSGAKG